MSRFEMKNLNLAENAKVHVIFLTILSSFILFLNLGEGSLSGDEGVHAEVAKEILKTGDWVTLHLKYAPLFDKPPLWYWLTAIAFKLLGVSEFSARFWTAVFGVGMVLVTYLLGKELFNKLTGFIASIILLTAPQFTNSWGYKYSHGAVTANVDICLSFFIALAALFLLMGQKDSRYFILSGASTGLAVMTKGVVGLIPAIAVFLFIFFAREFAILRNKNFYAGVLAFLVVALPWHLLQLVLYGGTFLNRYIVYNIIQRAGVSTPEFLSATSQFFYVDIIKQGFYPWSIFFIFALLYCAKVAFENREKGNILLLCWAAAVFVPFTYAQFRAPQYLLPIYPALSLIVAQFFYRFIEGKRDGVVFAGMFISIALWISLMPVVKYSPEWYSFRFDKRNVDVIRGFFISTIIFTAYAASDKLKHLKTAMSVFIVGTLLVSSVHMPFILDNAHDIARVAPVMKSVSNENEVLLVYEISGVHLNELPFYSDRRYRTVDKKLLTQNLESSDTVFALMKVQDYLKIRNPSTGVLAMSGGLVLITNNKSLMQEEIKIGNIKTMAELVEGLRLSKSRVKRGESVKISYEVRNTGDNVFDGYMQIDDNTNNSLFTHYPTMPYKLRPNETVRYENTFTVRLETPPGRYSIWKLMWDKNMEAWIGSVSSEEERDSALLEVMP